MGRPGRPGGRRGRLWDKGWPDHPGLASTVTLTVPFQDADPTGYAWHGNYFRYYDAARVELLAKLEFGYRQMADLGQMWPIVEARSRYVKSVPFGAQITVAAQLVEYEFRLRIYYDITNANGERCNEATTVQVPVEAATQALVIGVPDTLRTRVAQLIETPGS